MTARNVTDGNTNSAGHNVFPSSGYGGFYGTTPVTQQSTTLGTTVATTAAVSTSPNNTTDTSTTWSFSTSSQANNIVSLLNSIYTAMTSYGLLSS